MIFWLVLKLEISYRVIISCRILVSCRGFFENYIFCMLKYMSFHNSSFASRYIKKGFFEHYIFTWWNIWVSIILLFALRYIKSGFFEVYIFSWWNIWVFIILFLARQQCDTPLVPYVENIFPRSFLGGLKHPICHTCSQVPSCTQNACYFSNRAFCTTIGGKTSLGPNYFSL
jgi:hypothetical protein